MSTQPFADTLLDTERQLSCLAAAIVAGEPESLATAASALRLATLALADAGSGLDEAQRHDRQLMLRLRKLAQTLAGQRQSLMRRSALVERALGILVPAAQAQGYGQTGPGSRYASPGRPSGSRTDLMA